MKIKNTISDDDLDVMYDILIFMTIAIITLGIAYRVMGVTL